MKNKKYKIGDYVWVKFMKINHTNKYVKGKIKNIVNEEYDIVLLNGEGTIKAYESDIME